MHSQYGREFLKPVRCRDAAEESPQVVKKLRPPHFSASVKCVLRKSHSRGGKIQCDFHLMQKFPTGFLRLFHEQFGKQGDGSFQLVSGDMGGTGCAHLFSFM